MTVVTCGRFDCANCDDYGRCKADNVTLNYRNIATVNMGRQDILICNQYKMSENYKRMEEAFLERRVNENGSLVKNRTHWN